MGGIRPLPPARLEPPTFLEMRQQRLEEERFFMPGDEACTELGQHGKIEATILHFQTKRILPINSAPDRIRSLAIWQLFHELLEGNQR